MLGPFLKILLCIFIFFLLVLWPIAGIVGSILGGAAYGMLSPLIATFDAVGEGKTNQFIHCILVCFNIEFAKIALVLLRNSKVPMHQDI